MKARRVLIDMRHPLLRLTALAGLARTGSHIPREHQAVKDYVWDYVWASFQPSFHTGRGVRPGGAAAARLRGG
jgi:hypothetical protein